MSAVCPSPGGFQRQHPTFALQSLRKNSFVRPGRGQGTVKATLYHCAEVDCRAGGAWQGEVSNRSDPVPRVCAPRTPPPHPAKAMKVEGFGTTELLLVRTVTVL